MQSSTLSSRIKESAAGLAKDIFLNSINGYGALGTTDELAKLRSSHKASSAPSYGTSSSPNLSQSLSRQQHFGSEPFRDSDSSSTSDAGQELGDFLSYKDVLDSRSGSILDFPPTNEIETARGYRDHLRRNDSFEPELFGSKVKLPAQLWSLDRELSQQSHGQDEQSVGSRHGEVPPASSSLQTNHANAVAKNTSSDMASGRQKEIALDRLHLVFSQMPSAIQTPSVTTTNRTETLESSYNQLCGGEDAQEWAEFEAHMFRTYSGEAQASRQDLVQKQQYGPSTSVAARRAPLEVDRYEGHMLQHSEPSKAGLLQPDQAPKKDGKQLQSKEPIVEFHCPWIECHNRFQRCTDRIVSRVNSDSLPCVHTDCALKFGTEEIWRKHVDIAHHQLLPRPQPVGAVDLNTAWEKTQS